VAGPLGAFVDQLGPEPGLLLVDVDLGEVDAARKAVPVLANRRF
jgi:predicted amidohydrolase